MNERDAGGFKDDRNIVAGHDTSAADTAVIGLRMPEFDKRGQVVPEITDTRGYRGRHRRR